MAIKIPVVDMTVFLAGDDEWQSEWGITYVLDRILSYGNIIKSIYGLGYSVPTKAAKQYSEKNNIQFLHIDNSDNWHDSIFKDNGVDKPTHLILFANKARSNSFTNMLMDIGLNNNIMVCRAIDYINHFCFEVYDGDNVVDLPYYYNNKEKENEI